MNRLSVIGVAMVVGFVIVLALGIAKPNPFRGSQSVWATFDDPSTVASLDRDVRIAGGHAGKIGETRRVGDDAEVELILDDEDIRVTRDATAELRPHLAFEGSSFIELYPGSPSAPELGDSVIPKTRTRDYVSVDKVLRVADEPTRTALKDVLHDLAEGLGPQQRRGVRLTMKTLPRLYSALGVGARAAQGRRGDELRGALRGLARTVDAVAREEEDLVPGLRDGERTVAALDVEGGDPLERALSELPESLTALQSGGRSLRAIVDRLEPLSADLRPALRELTPAMRELRPLLQDLRPVLAEADPVLGGIQGALAAGGSASGPATGLLRALKPSIPLLDKEIVPGLLEKTRIGPPTYDALMRGGLTMGFDGALATLQTKAQDTSLGIGHGFRFNATAGSVPLNGVSPRCATIPESVRAVVSRLELCGP
ncbi:MAG TPA: hypothetical protein VD931_16665 [Baekduia sp.]|nr:hypothetical protein [Baekduia sp.]